MVNNYEKPTLSNDFVFGKVMEKKELCKKVLETLLQTKIDGLDYPQREKEMRLSVEGKTIRLDIYVKDYNDILYDAEMQNQNGKTIEEIALPKRSRYYQSVMDTESLKKGIHYRLLNDSYVIFICTFDPFGLGRYVYTFENICNEDYRLKLGDAATKVFFNTKAKQADIPTDIKRLFDYIETGTVSDALTQELDDEINKIGNDKDWWEMYMKTVVHDMDVRFEGIEIGRKEGIREGIMQNLISLVEDGILTVQEAAKRADLSEADFEEKMG